MSPRSPSLDDLQEYSDDSDDPSYREGSADEDDDVPERYVRDRADWVVQYADECAELYRAFKDHGRQIFGNSFLQLGSSSKLAHFIYKYTTPGANSD